MKIISIWNFVILIQHRVFEATYDHEVLRPGFFWDGPQIYRLNRDGKSLYQGGTCIKSLVKLKCSNILHIEA